MKTIRNLFLIIIGLALSLGVSRAQVTTNLLSETTFSPDAGSPWGFSYFYGNNGAGINSYNKAYYVPDDTDLTNAMFQLTFDSTDLAGTTGWGVGGGAPLFMTDNDPTHFSSGDRANYIFVFDARADGLLPDVKGNVEMQSQFYIGDKLLLQVNKGFQPTADWQTFAYTLDQGGLGANTADVDFEKQHAEVTGVRFNVNLHEPFNQFDNDGENALYIDNVKVYVITTPVPTPTHPVTIADWNMDDKAMWYEYHYEWSQNDNHATFFGSNNANGGSPNSNGVEGSAWYLQLDNSSFAEATPQWAGGGTGGGGPADYTQFQSGDLSKYQITYDACVVGLNPDKADTTLTLQVFLECPDGTIQPADSDGKADFVARLDNPIPHLTPQWQRFTNVLSKASIGGGSKANFETYFATINNVRLQWQIENAASYGDWMYDGDNMLLVDNIKIERLVEGLAPLTYGAAGDQMTVMWTPATDGVTKLQSAGSVEGPYQDVDTTGSMYTFQTTGSQQFFRLSWTQQ